MQNMVAAENGGWGGHMGEVVHSRGFLIFLVPSMRPQLTVRSVDFRSVHPKTCFAGGCVPLGSICTGDQIVPFLPPKTIFQWL